MIETLVPILSLALNIITVIINYLISKDKNISERNMKREERDTDFRRERWENAIVDAEQLVIAASIESVQDVIGKVWINAQSTGEDLQAESFKLLDDWSANFKTLRFKVVMTIKMLKLENNVKDITNDSIDAYSNYLMKLFGDIQKSYNSINELRDVITQFNTDDENGTNKKLNDDFNDYIQTCLAQFTLEGGKK